MHEFERQVQNVMDSQFPKKFQNHDLYSLFQVPPQQEEEPVDLEKGMEALVQI